MKKFRALDYRSFHKQMDSLLAKRDANELRTLIRTIADECHPRERAPFVERLKHHLGDTDSARNTDDIDAALHGIQEALDAALHDADNDSLLEDEDLLGPFREVMASVDDFLERVGNRLAQGDAATAREYYERVWALLEHENEFGQHPSLEEFDSEQAREHGARYLRAVYLSASPSERPAALYAAAGRVRLSGFHDAPNTMYPSLTEIASASNSPLPEWEETLDGLMAKLDGHFDPLGDIWLREVTQARSGVEGMAALAKRDGISRPRAWLDWAVLAARSGDDAQTLAAYRGADRVFPRSAPIRAEVGDIAAPAATRCDSEALAWLRYEAFLADPTVDRLLELWEAIEQVDVRDARLTQAADYLIQANEAAHVRQDRRTATPGSHLTIAAHASSRGGASAALTYLLAGQWQHAYERAQQAQPVGWISGDNAQSAVFSYALVALSVAAGAPPGPAATSLWASTLASRSFLHGRLHGTHELPNGELVALERIGENGAVAERFDYVITQTLDRHPLSASQARSWMEWCLQIAEAWCKLIVGNKHRSAYPRAASVIAACFETAVARGERVAGDRLVQQVQQRYSRHSAFRRALREAMTDTP